jgi:PAS domain S-box-containing protein
MKTERQKKTQYLLLFLFLVSFAVLIRFIPLLSNEKIHAFNVVICSLISLFTGILALGRYYAKRVCPYQVLGVAGLGNFIFVFTYSVLLVFFKELDISGDLSSLIAKSWHLDRSLLGLVMLYAWLSCYRKPSINDNIGYLAAGLLTFAALVLMIFTEGWSYSWTGISRKAYELVLGGVFLLNIVLFYREGKWRYFVFHHNLVMFLIANACIHFFFMVFSESVFDRYFFWSNVLRYCSCFILTVALMREIFTLFSEAKEREVILLESEKNLLEDRETLQQDIKDKTREIMLILENIPQFVWTLRPDGSVEYLNRNYASYLGPEVMEKKQAWSSTIHPQDRERLSRQWEEAFREGKKFEAEYRIRDREGAYTWFLNRSLPLKDRRGKVIKWIGTAINIQSKKEEEEELARSRIVLEKLIDERTSELTEAQRIGKIGNWHINFRTGEVKTSRETDRIFELGPDQARSFEGYLGCFAPDALASFKALLANCAFNSEDYFHEAAITTPSGSTKYLLQRGQVTCNEQGEIIELKGTIQDITDLKLTEFELERKNRILEKANAELEQYAYIASHDLKEPLRIVGGFTDLMLKKCECSGEAREYGTFIKQGIERMRNIIEDLLEYSTLDKVHGKFDTLRLNEVISDCLSRLGQRIRHSGAEVDVSPLHPVKGNYKLMRSMFLHLIENSLKFQAHGNSPRITIRSREENDRVIISVADNGLGIEPEFRSKIYLLFQRLQKREEFGGTGIGLSIVKKIVDIHQGEIWFDSEVNKGTTFYVSFPRALSGM